jgi:hypothetical protein
MDFLQLSDRLNTLLYRRQVQRLTREDREQAVQWTLQLIRERHPRWSEDKVRDYYDRVLDIRVIAVDAFSARHGEIRSL